MSAPGTTPGRTPEQIADSLSAGAARDLLHGECRIYPNNASCFCGSSFRKKLLGELLLRQVDPDSGAFLTHLGGQVRDVLKSRGEQSA